MVERYEFHRKQWYGRKSIVFFFCLLFTSLSLYAQEGTLHYGYLKLDGVEMKAGYNDGDIANGSLVFTENADGTLTLTKILGNSIAVNALEDNEAYGKTKEEFIANWKDEHQYDSEYELTDLDYDHRLLRYNGEYDGRYSVAHHNDASYWGAIEHVAAVADYEANLAVIAENGEYSIGSPEDIYITPLSTKVTEPTYGGIFIDPTSEVDLAEFNVNYEPETEPVFWEYRGTNNNGWSNPWWYPDYDCTNWTNWDADQNAYVTATGTEYIPVEYYEVMDWEDANDYYHSVTDDAKLALLDAAAEAAWEEALAELQAILDAGGSDLIAYHDALSSATTIEFPSEVDGMTVTAIDLYYPGYIDTSFDGGNNLTTIILPTTLTSITYFGAYFNNENCFNYPAITSINLDQLTSLEKVGDYGLSDFSNYAFYGTPITITYLDLTDATLGISTFDSYTTIQEAHIKNTTSTAPDDGGLLGTGKWVDIFIDDEESVMNPYTFFGNIGDWNPSVSSNTTFIVPDELYNAYLANNVWSKVKSHIKKASDAVATDFGNVNPAGFSSVELTGETHYVDYMGYKDVLIFKEDDKGDLYFTGIGYPAPTDEEKEVWVNNYVEQNALTWDQVYTDFTGTQGEDFVVAQYNGNASWIDNYAVTTFLNSLDADGYSDFKADIYKCLKGELAPTYIVVSKEDWDNNRTYADSGSPIIFDHVLSYSSYYDENGDFMFTDIPQFGSTGERVSLYVNSDGRPIYNTNTNYILSEPPISRKVYTGWSTYGLGYQRIRAVGGIGGTITSAGYFKDCLDLVSIDIKSLFNYYSRNYTRHVAKTSAWKAYLLSPTYLNNDEDVQAFIDYIQSATTITIPSSVDGKTVVGVNWTECISENLNSMLTVNLPTSATKIIAMPAKTKLPVVTTVNLSSMSNLREVGGFKGYSTLTGTYDLSQVKTYRNEAFSGCTGMHITKVDLKDGEVGMTPFVGVTVDELVYQNTKANGTNIRMLSGIKDCNVYIKEDSVMNANRFLAMDGDAYTLEENCTVYVPCPLIDSYKEAAGWKDIAGQIEPYGCEYYVIVDGNEEYAGVIYVEGSTPSTLELKKTSTKTGSTLEIPQSLTVNETTFTVTGIAGGGACKDRTDYTKVILPETLTSIGDDAFNGCSNVAEINLDNVTVYGDNAMKGCSSLTIHADFHNVTSIGSGAFQNSGLQSVWLRTLGDASEERSNVFGGCPNLLSIYLDQDDPTVVDPSHLGIVSGGKTAVFVSCTNVASAYTGSVKNPIEMYHLNDNWGKSDYWNSVYPMLHQVGGVEQGRKFSTFCFDKPIDFTGKPIKNTEHCIEGMLQYYLQPENNTAGFRDNRIEPLVVTGYTYSGGVEPGAGGAVSDESGSLTVANPGPRPAYTGILVRWHHDDEFNDASGLQEFYPLQPIRNANGNIQYGQSSFESMYPGVKSGTFVHEGEVNSGARNKFHDGSYVDQDAAGSRSYDEMSGVYAGEGFSNLLIGVTEKTDSIYYYPWFYAIATDGDGNEIWKEGNPVLDTANKAFDTHYKQFMLNGDQKRFQRCARMTESERMSGSWLRPYRAYLRLPILADGTTTTDGSGGANAAAPIKAYFYIDESNDGEATAISLKELTEEPGFMTPEGAVYNMSGQKVSDHGLDGLAPGLYIMNGKKVVKK